MKKLSVIIPTLNRQALLTETLKSIAKQTMPQEEFEILVIDNGSSDSTREVCQEYDKQHGNLRYIFDPNPGLHVGRNKGYQESASDLLVYADDDIVAFPTWLEAIYEGFEDKEVVLVGGSNLPGYEGTPPLWMDSLWDYDFDNRWRRIHTHSIIDIRGKAREIHPGAIFGCNFSIRKEILEKAEGFHPDGMPDRLLRYRGDGESYITNFISSNKFKAMFFPGASVYHRITKNRMTLAYIQKVSYRSGISWEYSRLRNKKGVISKLEEWERIFYLIKNSYIGSGNKINKLRNLSIARGQRYLLTKYLTDNRVREWVHRANYIGESGVVDA